MRHFYPMHRIFGPDTVGDEIRVTKELYIAPSDLWELILSLGGVKFWIVAMAPLYIGWVLAQPTSARHLFVNDLRVVLGLLVVGPFLGTFTLLFNTYYDMRTTDQANPRKRYVKIVEELVDPETLLLGSIGFAAIGVLLAFYISQNLISYSGGGNPAGPYAFVLLTLLLVGLSLAYSHPRLHWKGVAGMDLVTNMIGFGLICPAAGWCLLRPIEQAPWWYFVAMTLFLGAVYAPTTASDYESDRAFGIQTLAVHLGVKRTLLVGFVLQCFAVLALAIGWTLRAFPFSVAEAGAVDAMSRLWPFLGLQIVFYPFFVRRPTVGKIWALLLLLSITQGLGVLLMLFGFTGGTT